MKEAERRWPWMIVAAALALYAVEVSCEDTLPMLQDEVFFSGTVGGSVEISCAAQDYRDDCRFFRPDGNLVCDNLDEEEYSYNFDDADCFKDPNVKLLSTSEKCILRINAIDPAVHFGTWKCELTSWDKKGVATVYLKEAMPIQVDFVDVWGTVIVDIAQSSTFTFTCRVASTSGESLEAPPQEMVWKLGGKIVQRSTDFVQDSNNDWLQTFEYTPRTADDDQSIECSVMQAGQEKSDEIRLLMVMFKQASDSADTFMAEEGQPAVVTKTFTAFPRPTEDEIFWLLDTPVGPAKLKAGENLARFEAAELQSLGPNKYSMSLVIKKVAIWDDSAQHKLVLAPQGDSYNEQVIDVDISVQKQVKPSPPPPEVTSQRPPYIPSTEVATSTANQTLDIPDVSKASGSRISVIVIIVVVVLMILLCVLFYCTRWCRKRRRAEAETKDVNNAEEGTAENKDVEAPLIPKDKQKEEGNESNQADKAETLQDKEKELMSKLEPDQEASESKGKTQTTDTEKRDAEKTVLVSTKSEPLPKDHPSANDENKEISDMAKTIRQLSTGQGSPEEASDRDDQEPLIKQDKMDDKLQGATPFSGVDSAESGSSHSTSSPASPEINVENPDEPLITRKFVQQQFSNEEVNAGDTARRADHNNVDADHNNVNQVASNK